MNHKVSGAMCVIKPIKVESKIYVPEKPEKLKVMRNVKSLIKR